MTGSSWVSKDKQRPSFRKLRVLRRHQGSCALELCIPSPCTCAVASYILSVRAGHSRQPDFSFCILRGKPVPRALLPGGSELTEIREPSDLFESEAVEARCKDRHRHLLQTQRSLTAETSRLHQRKGMHGRREATG